MIAGHVTAVMVVVFRELDEQVVKMPLPEDDELIQAFQLDRRPNARGSVRSGRSNRVVLPL